MVINHLLNGMILQVLHLLSPRIFFEAGTRWYRTRDCLERLGSGYQYAGRADTNVKVFGGGGMEWRLKNLERWNKVGPGCSYKWSYKRPL